MCHDRALAENIILSNRKITSNLVHKHPAPWTYTKSLQIPKRMQCWWLVVNPMDEKESEKINNKVVTNTYLLDILDHKQSVLPSYSSVPDLCLPHIEFRWNACCNDNQQGFERSQKIFREFTLLAHRHDKNVCTTFTLWKQHILIHMGTQIIRPCWQLTSG